MANLIKLVKDYKLENWLREVSGVYLRTMGKAFRIGVMGKSGAGKSSFINSLCQKDVCKTGGVGGCTRKIQKVDGKLGDMPICIYDFPGIAENSYWHKGYVDQYKPYLQKLDIIFWMIKVDDRALYEDEKFYNEYIFCNRDISEKVIFILSQSDKSEPMREWNWHSYKPSNKQLDKIYRNCYRIFCDFSPDYPHQVIPISTNFSQNHNHFNIYNFDLIFEMFLFKLNNISKLSDKLPIELSLGITKKEMNRILNVYEKFNKYTFEGIDDLCNSLDVLLEELKS